MYTIEEFDNAKTRVLKYVLYKKRTEHEVRVKFRTAYEEGLLEDVIAYLKEAGYINDIEYIEKAIKEMKYKLQLKGINKEDIEAYMERGGN